MARNPLTTPRRKTDFGAKIEAQFPAVKWYGSSEIHRSTSRYLSIDTPPRDKIGPVLRALHLGQLGPQLYTHLRGLFTGGEWLVKGQDLTHLLMVDFYSHLQGKGPFYTAGRLTNPRTGNRFHKIMIAGEVVAGIRVWADTYDGDYVSLGLRVRLEQLVGEVATRETTAKDVLDAGEEYHNIGVGQWAAADPAEIAHLIATIKNALGTGLLRPTPSAGDEIPF